VVIKVAGVIGDLTAVIRAAEAVGATVVSRAALGLSWVALAASEDLVQRVASVRGALPPGTTATVLDGAGTVADPWPQLPAGARAVTERLKARFDPARVFRPGAFVGGL